MTLKSVLNGRMPKTQASYVEMGYGQVEPNHLSAQRTGQIYAQLPAKKDIEILEQGQFVKYDYAANDNGIGEVNFTGAGEWMLVYNEVKIYADMPDGSKMPDCTFAMIKDDYQARIYSPYDYEVPEPMLHTVHNLTGKGADGTSTFETVNQTVTADAGFKTVTIDGTKYALDSANKITYNGNQYEFDPKTGESKTVIPVRYNYDQVAKKYSASPFETGHTDNPWQKLGVYGEKKMPEGTAMVPRVFKTNVGDIFTTNTVKKDNIAVGKFLTPGVNGILEVKDNIPAGDMKWQVVKVYTMPDGQPGVKIMRVA